jgi:hypothetical protein
VHAALRVLAHHLTAYACLTIMNTAARAYQMEVMFLA